MRLLRQRSGPALLAACAGLLLLAGSSLAANGKIAGKVTDEDGAPLVGANIVTTVGSAQRGATTDDEGKYFIINIPPGVYDVTSSYIGHQSLEQKGIVVKLDLTSNVDFELSPQAIEGEAVSS